MLELIAITTNDGPVFVCGKNDVGASSYHGSANLPRYRFDGEKPQETFARYWFVLKKMPELVTEDSKVEKTNRRFELYDNSLSDKFPNVLTYEDVDAAFDGYGNLIWRNREYSSVQDLYAEKWDYTEPEAIQVEFSVEVLMNIESSELNRVEFSYPTAADFGKPGPSITQDSLSHQLLDKILFPSLVLHKRPVSLSSKQVYAIVREHVRKNIDGAVARITSDYNFCFTVKRVVKLATPYRYTVDLNAGYKRRRQKLVEKVQVEKLEECFEMTSAEDRYKGYTVISGITADNDAELKETLDKYLDDLMEFINMRVEECIHCNGTGHKIDGKAPQIGG